jgi:hypothetical protein
MTRLALVITWCALVLSRSGGAPWYDEAFTLAVRALPFPQMLQAIMGDVHPPLYYLLPEPRLLALALGALALWQMSAISLPGAALVAAAPMVIFHSGEWRMYGLLWALYALCALALMRGRTPPLWAALALPLVHYVGIIYAGALAVYALMRHRPALALQLTVTVPLALAFRLAQPAAEFWLWTPQWQDVLLVWWQAFAGAGQPGVAQVLMWPLVFLLWPRGFFVEVPAAMMLGVSFFAPMWMARTALPAVVMGLFGAGARLGRWAYVLALMMVLAAPDQRAALRAEMPTIPAEAVRVIHTHEGTWLEMRQDGRQHFLLPASDHVAGYRLSRATLTALGAPLAYALQPGDVFVRTVTPLRDTAQGDAMLARYPLTITATTGDDFSQVELWIYSSPSDASR